MFELDSRDFIDRKAEQELFSKLVTFTTPARTLTICDNGGRGKSSLLKRLLYNCRYELQPRIPACLVELDRLSQPSGFALITQIVDGLPATIDGVTARDKFAKFKQLDDARRLKDFSMFGSVRGVSVRAPVSSIHASATVGGQVGAGGVAAGVYAEQANMHIENPQFTDEQEQLARQLCVDAFFEDLRVVCAVQPIVIMFDAWERCNIDLRDWLVDMFFANRCFNSDRNLRPTKLAIVVAGRPHSKADPRGLRSSEFRPLFNDEQAHEETITSIRSLSEWESEHVREFMSLNGYKNPSETEIQFMKEQLNKGWPLEKILYFIEKLVDQDRI